MKNDKFDIYSWRKDFLREKLLIEAENNSKKDKTNKKDIPAEEITPEEDIAFEDNVEFDSSMEEPTTDNIADSELKIQGALKTLFDKSKEINDPKFTTLISNTITYFTKNHITKTEN